MSLPQAFLTSSLACEWFPFSSERDQEQAGLKSKRVFLPGSSGVPVSRAVLLLSL